MKKVLFFAILIAITATGWSQKKSDLAEKISELELSLNAMRTENSSLAGTVKTLTEANRLLEDRVKFQEEVYKKQVAEIDDLKSRLEELSKQKASAGPATSAAAPVDYTAIIENPQNETDSIISLIQHYASARTPSQRLQYIYNSNKLRPVLEKYYKEELFSVTPIDSRMVSISGEHFKVGDKFIVWARGPFFSSEKYRIRKTADGFKVDWEATVGYNAVNLDTYLAEKRTDKIRCRILVSGLDEYFNSAYFSFSDGIVKKSSAAGQRLASLTNDGRIHRIIVEGNGMNIQDDDGYSRFKFVVTRIVSEDWFDE